MDESIDIILDEVRALVNTRDSKFNRWYFKKVQSSFSSTMLRSMKTRRKLIAKEREILNWAETTSTEEALDLRSFILLSCVKDELARHLAFNKAKFNPALGTAIEDD